MTPHLQHALGGTSRFLIGTQRARLDFDYARTNTCFTLFLCPLRSVVCAVEKQRGVSQNRLKHWR